MKLWEKDLKTMEIEISKKMIVYEKSEKGYQRWYNRNIPKIRERIGVMNTTILLHKSSCLVLKKLDMMSDDDFNDKYNSLDELLKTE